LNEINLRLKLGRDADHSPPSSAEVKNEQQLYLLSPHVSPWRVAGQLFFKLKSCINSCAVAQAVSCGLLVSQTRVLAQGSPVIFVADQVALGQFFL
jgi:hypothetical protein